VGEPTPGRGSALALPTGTVTFLFTDIEGSTPLLRELGRERYGEILASHRELLADAVEGHGGIVVDTQGDAVLAVFASAQAAVASAIQAQLALAAADWAHDRPLKVRMGLHSGEPTLTETGYVGVPLHRGKRVCDSAHGGQVLLSAATRELVMDELPPGASLRHLGRHELAGFDSAEAIFQLVAEGLQRDFPPVRTKSGRAQTQLLERSTELARLRAAVEATRAGSGRLSVIEGAAGIGKTSLLTEGRAMAEASGMRVLQGRGSELEQTFPYGIVRQLFEPALARASSTDRERLLDGAAALAAPLFAGGAVSGLAGDAADATFGILHGLYWLTANLADSAPVLMAIDDLHWADSASLRWLAYLAHRIEGHPVLCIASLRPLQGDADPHLAELLVDPATLTMQPTPLTQAAIAAMIADRVSAELLDEVAAACHEATGGNPLLLRELLSAVLDKPDGDEDTDLVAEVRRAAPEVVSRRVRLQLTKLGPEATALARAAAVLGDDAVCAQCVPELAGLTRDEADRLATRLSSAEVLEPNWPLRFTHPIVRAAVYDALGSSERGATHARAAELLIGKQAPIERIAAQLLQTPPSGSRDVVDRLLAAAEQSLSQGAPESAIAYLTRALAEPPPEESRMDVLLVLADAEGRTGAPGAVEHLREALGVLSDPARRSRARLDLARGLFWRSQEEEALAELEAVLAEAHDVEPPLRRTIEADYYAAALRLPALHESAHERLRLLEPSKDDDLGARMLLATKAYAAAFEGERLKEAVELGQRALAGANPYEEAPSWTYWYVVNLFTWADRFDLALPAVEEALAEARRRNAVYLFAGASMVRAMVGYSRGALLEAEADAHAAVDALPDPSVLIAPLCHSWLAHVLVERGNHEGAAAALGDAGADSALEERFVNQALFRARGVLRFAQGDFRGATADALASGRIIEAVGMRNPAITPWRTEAALAHISLGDTDTARQLATEELARTQRWGAQRPIGRALRVLGIAESGEHGLEHLRQAVHTLEHSPARLEQARSLAELGAALRRLGKRTEARDRLRAGLELASQCGAEPLTQRAREELIAAGAKPRSRAVSGVEALTPSERRIAAMAAEGMTNRDIAQALFVTPRTVEMHLSNAFRKLDIGSRTQLVEALAGTRQTEAPSDDSRRTAIGRSQPA
jgi:class 3 adenylate cyclase/DNA-binding CsgD family transcriptional regulator/tetratricopeptide (TPR) repeat protein